MISWEAVYFDGRSSLGYPTYITLEQEAIVLVIFKSEEWQQLRWDIKHVHKSKSLDNEFICLQYGASFPYQTVEVKGSPFQVALKERYPHAAFVQSKTSAFFSSSKGFGMVLLGFISFTVLSYFFLIPEIADYGARVLPVSYEEKLGNQLYERVINDYSVDTPKTEAINNFFRLLHVNSEYKVRITVVNNPEVNAFALPGGNIVVYDSILKVMTGYEQLAALLGHEYSHVALKHNTRGIFRNLSAYLFLSILFNDINGISGVVLNNAENLKSLQFSRKLEEEADKEGLKFLIRNSINPQGMVQLMEHLKKLSQSLNVELISTHPVPETRIRYVKALIASSRYKVKQHDSLQYYFRILDH